MLHRSVKALLIALAALGCSPLFCQNVPALFDRPGGLVPDEQTAIKIAEAILFPIYGEKHIRDEKPYVVKLANGKWTIDGSMPKTKAASLSSVACSTS